MTALDIDGSTLSGSGMVVRQAMAFAAVTGTAFRMTHVRARRPHPGLRPQHLRAVEAVAELVGGRVEGAHVGSRAFEFEPGERRPAGDHRFDVGTSGSATALALALLPVARQAEEAVRLDLVGGTFQDGAPSAFHLQHVLAPLLGRLGVEVGVELVRPGYVPSGGGELRLLVRRTEPTGPLLAEQQQPVRRIWGISLASHLAERRVASRMAEAARRVLSDGGRAPDAIEEREDATARQRGAALAVFADLADGLRLGADRAGAPGRSAERVGSTAASRLLEDLSSGATLDRFASDQLIVFAALAGGRTRVRLAALTDHVRTALWLMDLFGCGRWQLDGRLLTIEGAQLPA